MRQGGHLRQALRPRRPAPGRALVRRIEAEGPDLVAAGQIDLALARIREVPEALRTIKLRGVLEDLERRQAEIAELDRIIGPAIDGPLTVELMG